MSWGAAEASVSLVASVAALAITAHLIGPKAFGVASVAYLIVTTAELFVFAPFAEALVQKRRLAATTVNAAHGTMLMLGLAAFASLVLASPAIARLFGEPQLAVILPVQSVTCLLVGLRAAPEALLARSLSFRALAIRNIAAKGSSAVLSVVLAAAGFGAWSMVAGNVAFSLVSTVVVLLAAATLPRFGLDVRRAAALTGFGAFALVNTLLVLGTPRLFGLAIGYFAGASIAGQVNLALRILDTSASLVVSVSSRMALPVLAKLAHNPPRLEEAYHRGVQITFTIAAAVLVGLASVSPELVTVLLGPQWSLAPLALSAIALTGALAFATLADPALKAVGSPGISLVPHAVSLAVLVAGAAATRPEALEGWLLLWAMAAFVRFAVEVEAVHRSLGVGVGRQLAALLIGCVCALVLAIAVHLVREFSRGGPGLTLGLEIIAGALAFTSVVAAAYRLRLWGGGASGRTP
jgi:lipopolysaccharide exporter